MPREFIPCPVCKSGEDRNKKWITQGVSGSSDELYYCEECGVARVKAYKYIRGNEPQGDMHDIYIAMFKKYNQGG
jgi:uncharacterized Zn finger protein